MDEAVTNYRKQAISAAKDFHYGKETLRRLKQAKSEAEICRIMITARQNKKW